MSTNRKIKHPYMLKNIKVWIFQKIMAENPNFFD